MATIKTSFVQSVFPSHFFPDASPAMKAFLWQSLTDQHSSVREAIMQFLGDSLQTLIAKEFVDMMIDDYEKSWGIYCTAEILKTATEGRIHRKHNTSHKPQTNKQPTQSGTGQEPRAKSQEPRAQKDSKVKKAN